MEQIELKGRLFDYEIIRMKKKNLSFRYVDDKLVIRVPLYISKKDILAILKLNEDSIIKKLVDSPKVKKEPLSFSIGQKIKVLGEEYLIEKGSRRIELNNSFFVRENYVEKDVLSIALIKLDTYVSKRTREYFDSMYTKGNYPSIKYRYVKGYYGKYSKSKHEIIYNIALAFLDKELIDYIIVHELSHIKYLNHQKEFYDFLKIFLPNYKYLEKRLKVEGRVKWK